MKQKDLVHAVRTEQFVDGPPQDLARDAGMSASAIGQGATRKGKTPLFEMRNAPNSLPCGISRLGAQHQPGFEHHPQQVGHFHECGRKFIGVKCRMEVQ
jgi:hypothetical protein